VTPEALERRSSLLYGQYSPEHLFVAPQSELADLESAPCVPAVELNTWDRISGNVPNVLLTASQFKDEVLLRGVTLSPEEGDLALL
jgi:hypothetical protein